MIPIVHKSAAMSAATNYRMEINRALRTHQQADAMVRRVLQAKRPVKETYLWQQLGSPVLRSAIAEFRASPKVRKHKHKGKIYYTAA